MSLPIVQQKLVQNTTVSTNQCPITLDQAPAQGNLLLLVVFADKSKTISPPAGQNWTVRVNVSNPSLSYMLATKVAGANEPASITSTLNLSTNGASTVYVREYSGNYALDAFTSAYSGESPSGASQATGTTGALTGSNGHALAFWSADSAASVQAGNTRQWSTNYVENTSFVSYADPAGNSGVPPFSMAQKTNNLNTNGESATFSYTVNGVAADQMAGLIVVIHDTEVVTPAVLTSPAASNVATTTATVGAATSQTSGTLYAVLTTSSSLLSGITAAQIIAGHDNTNGNAAKALSSSITGANPSMNFTALNDGVTYYAAIVQVNANGNSNIVTTSFTTQVLVVTRSTTFRLYNPISGLYLANTTIRVWSRLTMGGAAVDGGISGLAVTTDANGWANVTGLTIEAGAGLISVGSGSDSNHFLTYPVTFA